MTLIAAKANVSPRTVRRYLDGNTKTHSIVENAIKSAAKELKMSLKSLRKVA